MKSRAGLNLLATVLTLLVGWVPLMVTANPADMVAALQAAPTGNDLPLGQQESAGSLGAGRLRPQLSYPTLRMDNREPRQNQIAVAPPEVSFPDAAPGFSDFQMLVSQTLGVNLPRFGHNLFADNVRGFEPIDPALIPPDFVLGPGDEIYVRAWGSVEIDFRATITREGSISLPKVGEISLAGIRYGDLATHLEASLGRIYQGFELSVSLGQLRSIRVYLTGFVRTPGTYTVNSLTSLVNALFFAGGPSFAGDLRQIELRRSGELLTRFDFYDFLIRGDYDNDLRLQPGDVIHIPPMLGEVAIAGAVNRPAIYQLQSGDKLSDLISWAGGLGVTAATHRIVLERISDGQRLVEELPLTPATKSLQLLPGDLVLIQPLSPQFSNAVTLRGNVAQPFRHEWRSGMRVSDVLPSTEALISPGYWASRNRDSQLIELLSSESDTNLDTSFPEINWEYAIVERVDRQTLRTKHIPFHLGKAVKQRLPEHDLVLQPEDKITVFSLRDFRTPIADRKRLVRIEGEVQRAGYYEVEPGAGIADIIEMAGGLTGDAYLYGTELRREAVRQQQRLRINEAIDQLEQDYNRHLIDRSRNVLSGDLTLSIAPEADAIRNLISRLRDADPSGRIILELEDASIASAEQLPDFPLDDGDEIYVPPKPATIEVVGAVFRQGSFLHASTDRITDYIENAGLLNTADSRQIYLIRPDGSFEQARNRTRLSPGDTVFVPEKTDRQRTVRRLKDWTQVVYQFGLGAAGNQSAGGILMDQNLTPVPMRNEQVHSILPLLLVIAKRLRFLIIVPFLSAVVAVVYSLTTDPVYIATARILPPQYNENTVMAMQNDLGGESQLGNAALTLQNPTDLFVGILTSRTIMDAVIEARGLRQYYGEEEIAEARRILGGATEIRAAKDGIVSILVEDTDPEIAALLANTYIDEFYRFSESLARDQAQRRSEFYRVALESARQELVRADLNLFNTEQETGYTRLMGQDQAIVLAAAELEAQISAREVQLKTMSSYATESNPDYRLIVKEVENLRAELDALLGQNQNPGASDDPSEPFVALGNAPEALLAHTQSRRDVEYWENMVMLIGRFSELGKIDERRDMSLFQVLDWAVPPHDKSKPRTRVNAILAVLGSGFVCLLWVLASAYVAQRREQSNEFDDQWQELCTAILSALLIYRRRGKANG